MGYEVGEWHVSHDRLVQYMTALAQASDRITLENRGYTFERRPLLLLTITSPENHQRIDEIKAQHQQLTTPEGSNLAVENMPAVLYQGFSIHGNEPSGANAGLLAAYHLAASEDPETLTLLDEVVVLFDPSFNPDGLQRFAYWANTNRSMNLNPDNNDREYSEVWPGGRTNHYWFDLNRDWLPTQLPESQARIKTYIDWLPNVLTDHHEMGTNSSFFFQPGIPDRVNPLTPDMNQKLTQEIGKFHAAAFDELGSLYYSEEDYDDFFYGKGSTYPDINGSIGILFEQASSRGHLQNSDNGVLTFPFTIRNQLTAAFSTLKAVKTLRMSLLEYMRSFYSNAAAEAAKSKQKALVFGNPKDPAGAYEMARVMDRHGIQLHKIRQSSRINGQEYPEAS
ncbi:MAG: M14 family metallopeptidase, partial [Flavobacteriaceae bacterium]